jgi:hypothetical protein
LRLSRDLSSGFVKGLFRVLVLFGLVLFALAIFCPFVTAQYFGMKIPEVVLGPTMYWSFMQQTSYYSVNFRVLGLRMYSQTTVFADYWLPWFDNFNVPRLCNAGLLIITLFEMQIATVVTGVLAITRPRLGFASAPTFLAASSVLLMTFFSSLISYWNIVIFGIGFWLTVLSVAPFALAVIITAAARPHEARVI